jgi:hypothetical protein
MAFIFLVAAGDSQAADSSLLARCRQLFASPSFDCECVAKHLDPNLGLVEAEIALEAWSLSLRGAQESSRDFEVLYHRHTISEVNRALFHFLFTRTELLMKCPQAGPEGEDDY